MSEAFLEITTTISPPYSEQVRSVVETGSLNYLPYYLGDEALDCGRVFAITDSNVNALYGDRVQTVFDEAAVELTILEMPAGEQNKNLAVAASFIEDLSDQGANRSDTIVALGGGVVGDLGGFVASIYNRGVPLVQVPTTVLAMVDASIGGKTGIDHGGKNKTGSFHQPRLVVADPSVLSTLDTRVYREGFGEVVKYAMLDADFLPKLEAESDNLSEFSTEHISKIGEIIARSVKQKSDVIEKDPLEQKPDGRILLNYGHTLAHGLEAAGGYTELFHGEAVAIGMNFAAKLAVELELAEPSTAERQQKLLENFSLPTEYDGIGEIDEIMRHIAKDKKNFYSGRTRFVLPRGPGDMVVKHVDNSDLSNYLANFLATAELS